MQTISSRLASPLILAAISLSLSAESYTIGNKALSRTLDTSNGTLKTVSLNNKLAKLPVALVTASEFSLRFSQGTDKVGTDFTLRSQDFKILSHKLEANNLNFVLKNDEHDITVDVEYSAKDQAHFMHKQLTVTSGKRICLERIDIDALTIEDAYQPYQEKKITAQAPGQWKPGLGQPLFTYNSGTYWGTEFPASSNTANEGSLRCGYLHGQFLEANQPYTTFKSVVGVSDDPQFTSDAFYDYINNIRVRPLRLQTQYNSWFDFHKNVTKEDFRKAVTKVNAELCEERGVTPLKCYVIDDGWQDSKKDSDWSQKVWAINEKFTVDFKFSHDTIKSANSTLGLWMSPGCHFGARPIVPKLREMGYGALTNYMSLSDTKYMKLLEQRMVELTTKGTTYFKLDGLFGHLNTRDFDIDGADNGVPTMPQLGTKGWRSNGTRLNDSKYNELKTYYLAKGSERMMQIFAKMAAVNPEVYIVISNGAYLSPWWLMHCDAVWMINAGDAAGGSNRTQELIYRDGVYHNIWLKENTHYPMNSLFNHEPKKTKNNESKDTFRKYLYMNMSRGTGFVELYLKTFNLVDYDWDVLAEGMLWVEDVFPTFARSRMHGGDPARAKVYGYTAWNSDRGYVSLHNPDERKAQTYRFTLDRSFGLIAAEKSYFLSSPLDDSVEGLASKYQYGDTITVKLQPGEIRILNFDQEKRDWKKLKALQTRTKDDFVKK